MIAEKEVFRIGEMTRTHGNRGEIQCRMINDCWENSDASFIILLIDSIRVPFRVKDWRCKGTEDVLFSLQDIDQETQAANLVGTEVYMLKKDFKQDQQDLLTWQDIVGYEVIDDTQGSLGTICSIDESTINTLLILGNQKLIPAHEDLITRIDEEHKILYVSLPIGL